MNLLEYTMYKRLTTRLNLSLNLFLYYIHVYDKNMFIIYICALVTCL